MEGSVIMTGARDKNDGKIPEFKKTPEASRAPQTPQEAAQALLSGDPEVDTQIGEERPKIERVLENPAQPAEVPATVSTTPTVTPPTPAAVSVGQPTAPASAQTPASVQEEAAPGPGPTPTPTQPVAQGTPGAESPSQIVPLPSAASVTPSQTPATAPAAGQVPEVQPPKKGFLAGVKGFLGID